MDQIWLYSIISVVIVSLISLIGVFTLSLTDRFLKKILMFLVSFSAGALLGDAFIHLLPELVEENGFGLSISLYVLLGIIIFFIVEKFLHWHHCHHSSDGHEHSHHIKPLAWNNIISDGFHNFLDGLIIAGSYAISVPIGIATTLAVIFHEIPQEIGDFGLLIYSGFSKGKALFFNFISSLSSILGAIVGLFLVTNISKFELILIPLTVGNFIYIAAADVIPELHKETDVKKSLIQLLGLILGIGVMVLLVVME